jgi:hypothetical protein
MVPDLRCVECGMYSGLMAWGWLAVRCDEPEVEALPELAFYCPDCARAEFGVETRREPRAD